MIDSAARGRLVGALALGLWAGALACDSSSTLATKAECTPGAVARCACSSGPEGTRIGTTLGQYGSCGCAGGLAAGDDFLAFTSDAAGARLVGLVGPGSYDNPCSAGCSVQHIDIAARRVLSEKRYLLELGTAIAAHDDSTCGRLLLVYAKPGSRPGLPGEPAAAYQAALLAY
jgi:hypothetical protein